MTQMTPNESNAAQSDLYIGIDLGGRTWKLAFSNGSRFRFKTIEAWELGRLSQEVEAARRRLAVNGGEVISCHEAGRDGFSVHRALEQRGLRSMVVDPSSIEVDRRKRRAKTDRLDAKKLVRQLMRYTGGDTDSLRVVRVPSVEQEDERRLSRERERLQKEMFGHTNRIKSLLTPTPFSTEDGLQQRRGNRRGTSQASLQSEAARMQHQVIRHRAARIEGGYQH